MAPSANRTPVPALLDYGLLAVLFAECGDELMGLKLRISRNWTGQAVYEPVLTVKRGMVVYRNILL